MPEMTSQAVPAQRPQLLQNYCVNCSQTHREDLAEPARAVLTSWRSLTLRPSSDSLGKADATLEAAVAACWIAALPSVASAACSPVGCAVCTAAPLLPAAGLMPPLGLPLLLGETAAAPTGTCSADTGLIGMSPKERRAGRGAGVLGCCWVPA